MSESDSQEGSLSKALWELANIEVDIDRLKREMSEVRSSFVPYMVTSAYGGWSLLSSTGDYLDGWLKPGTVISGKVRPDDSLEDYVKAQQSIGIKPIREYCMPTQAYTPYFAELHRKVSKLGLQIFRARLAILKRGSSTVWHQDAPTGIYSARLHIALETNDKCFFEWRDSRLHMPDNGSAWFLRVDLPHRAVNFGESDRLHIIANVFDIDGVSSNFRFPVVGK